MEYLVPGKIFENMLQVIHFSVHFKIILNTTNIFLYINNDSSAHVLGGLELCTLENFFSN